MYAEFSSELGAHMSAEMLGNEAFIDRVIRSDASLAEKIIGKIIDAKDALGRIGDPEAQAQHKRLAEAEKLYLKAIEAAGYQYVNGKIVVPEDEKENTAEGGVAQEADRVKYSLKIKHTDGSIEELADARNLTEGQAIEYLKQAQKGSLQRSTYIPVRKDTPQVIIDALEQENEFIENCSMVMQVKKARQSMGDENPGNRKGRKGSNVRRHGLSPEEIVAIVNQLDNPTDIVYQTNRTDENGNSLPNNIAVFVEYKTNGNEGVAVVEFNPNLKNEIGEEFGDTRYHTVVTAFEPDVIREGEPFDYLADELLLNPNNILLKIERGQDARSATGEKHPNTSSKMPSNPIIPEVSEKSTPKPKFSLKENSTKEQKPSARAVEKAEERANKAEEKYQKERERRINSEEFNKVANRVIKLVNGIKEWKKGTFENAADAKNGTFKNIFGLLGNIASRGNISPITTRKAMAAIGEWYGKPDEHPVVEDLKASKRYDESMKEAMKAIGSGEGALTVEELRVVETVI